MSTPRPSGGSPATAGEATAGEATAASILYEELASVGQRMLWLVERYRGGLGRLNYPLLLRLRGRLDVPALRQAVDTLVARHEALRTTFARRSGLLTQLVHQPATVPLVYRTVRATPGGDVRHHAREEITTPIEAARNPLRVTLWRLDGGTTGTAGRDGEDHLLCLNIHHLVTDAWSCRILVEELVQLLAGNSRLPRVGWQYRHYAQWQRRPSTADRQRTDEEYWRGVLAGAQAPALRGGAGGRKPADSPPGPERPGEPAALTVEVDRQTADRLRELARRERSTLFAVLLGLLLQALHEETGQRDLALAAPFANRARPEVMRTVGFFANLLVLRAAVEPGLPFPQVLRRAGDSITGALAHQSFPHYLPPADSSQARTNRAEDVVFQMLPQLPPPTTVGDLEIEVLPPDLPSRFDLELAVVTHHRGMRATFQYAVDRVDGARIGRLARRYATALATFGAPKT